MTEGSRKEQQRREERSLDCRNTETEETGSYRTGVGVGEEATQFFQCRRKARMDLSVWRESYFRGVAGALNLKEYWV